jgi:hypothetical protein
MSIRTFPGIIIILTLLILAPGSYIAGSDSDMSLSQETVRYYFDLIASGNCESAIGLWEPGSRGRAARLEVEYDDVCVKADCNSPVIYDLNNMKKFLWGGIVSNAEIDSGVIRWTFRVEEGDREISHLYYTVKKDDYFWLITPQDYYARDWPVEQSKYFRFYINPEREKDFNEIAASSLDNFVESVAESIAIPEDRLRLLSEMKIDYYLCRNSREVALFSGKKEDGIYDPSCDAVITTMIPHFHEVARLLINFRLQKLPLVSLPFIRQGLAAHLGGRWQRSAQVVADFGKYILKYGILEIDSVLAPEGHEDIIENDLVDPVSACVVEYLLSALGYDRFFELYINLSGDYEFLRNISVEEVKAKLCTPFGIGWEDLKANFAAYVESGGVSAGMIYPGEIRTDRVLIEESGLTISASKEWIQIEYQHGDTVRPDIGILFSKSASLEGKRSALFREQYRGEMAYPGYRFGVRVDKNEIGLYDYAINQIKAKYIDAFRTGTGYYDSTQNKISAYFSLDLLEGTLPDVNDHVIVR